LAVAKRTRQQNPLSMNKAKLYAKALAEVIAEGKVTDKKTIAKNFAKMIILAGYEHKIDEILELAQELLLQKQGKRKIVLESARKLAPGQKKILETFVKKGDLVEEKISPELIAGIKITVNSEMQFDNSLQRKLNTL
jgi:F0F1-type ATP synthase delta subunit